jgi:hypothetical protein
MSRVVHLVPILVSAAPPATPGNMFSACGITVFPGETERIATSVETVTCESCKRTVAYTVARRKENR